MKVYVTDYTYNNLDQEKHELGKFGIEVIGCHCRTEEEIIQRCADADGLLNLFAPIGAKVMDALPNLKVIARYGVGLNTIDIPAATQRNIVVLNVPDYCCDEVTNHALALIMNLHRGINVLNSHVQRGEWDYKCVKPIRRLSSQTIGMIGFGHIARVLAVKCRAFGLETVACCTSRSQQELSHYGATKLSFGEVMRTADIVTIHVPYNEETANIIDAKAIAMMKPTAFLVNTARGGLVDEAALADAIRHGRLAGAGIDVTAEEPLPADSPLRGLDNVIITPHSAWYSEEAELDVRTLAARGLGMVMTGYDTINIVNTELREKLNLKDPN